MGGVDMELQATWGYNVHRCRVVCEKNYPKDLYSAVLYLGEFDILKL
jgi:hypothetical protein